MTNLKSGMLVTTSDGQSYIVVNNNCGPGYLYSPFGCKRLEDASDIIRIEEPIHGSCFSQLLRYYDTIWVDGVGKNSPLFNLKNFAFAIDDLEKCYGLVLGSQEIANSDEHLEAFRLIQEGIRELTEYIEENKNDILTILNPRHVG